MKNLLPVVIAALIAFGAGYFIANSRATTTKPAATETPVVANGETGVKTDTVKTTKAGTEKTLNAIKTAAALTSNLGFTPSTQMIRVVQGTKKTNDDIFTYVVTYNKDNIHVDAIDTLDLFFGMNVVNSAGTYTLKSPSGSFATLPVFTYTTYTLLASSLTSKNGVITGKDSANNSYSFGAGDIVAVTGNSGGTISFGVVQVETYL